jgi:hypothetical protein
MDSLFARVDAVNQELQGLKGAVFSLNQRVHALEDSGNHLRSEVDDIQHRADKLYDQTDYLENQSRRNNLVFTGIEEHPSETWEVTESKVKSHLVQSLGFTRAEAVSMTIERAHRTRNPPRAPGSAVPSGPRPVVAKFLSYKDREAVLRRAREQRPDAIFVNEDVSTRVRERRRDQLAELKRQKALGKIAYFSLDKLIVKEKRSRNSPAATQPPREPARSRSSSEVSNTGEIIEPNQTS